MINTAQITTDFNLIVSVIGQDVPLTPEKHTGAFFGACPLCQDAIKRADSKDNSLPDRFRLFSNGNNRSLFFCRQCEAKGDVIEYLKITKNMDFKTAVSYITGNEFKPAKPLTMPKKQKLTASEFQAWQDKALELTGRAASHLLNVASKEAYQARQWLEGRGIGTGEIIRYSLGFNDKWRMVHKGKNCKLPAGILIPWFDASLNVTAVNVYMTKEGRKLTGRKRQFLRGSKPNSLFFNTPEISQASKIILCEGELDCILLNRLLSEILPDFRAITAGGVEMMPPIEPIQNKPVYLLMDNDPSGKRANQKWLGLLPTARPLGLPEGQKDITDFYKSHSAETVKNWILKSVQA